MQTFLWIVVAMLAVDSLLNRWLQDRRYKMTLNSLVALSRFAKVMSDDYLMRNGHKIYPNGICANCWNKFKDPQRYKEGKCTNQSGPCVYHKHVEDALTEQTFDPNKR